MKATAPSTPSSNPLAPALPPVLKGTRILSLALNIPGPVALARALASGARCTKLEPPVVSGVPSSGDPMSLYCPDAYQALHAGMRMLRADLKTEKGRALLHRELARTHVLVTSFRPSALRKLGLGWQELHRKYPTLCVVQIFGGTGERAEEAGHDLTYQAESGLISGTQCPTSLFADMGGALMCSEAILQARMHQLQRARGICLQVALSEAAAFLALPRDWGLTDARAFLGGAHAGYKVYPCRDGRVALAALEPHFVNRLLTVVNLPAPWGQDMHKPRMHKALAAFMAQHTRKQLDQLARTHDIPLYTLTQAT